MAKFGIGQAVRRVEDQRFLLGQGRYVDDISLSGQCHGVTVLSPHAHARITRIDVAKAKAAPGVLCVLTGADAVAEKLGSFTAHLMPEDFGAPKGHRTFQPVLNADKVRFVGDRVAFVVAETLAQTPLSSWRWTTSRCRPSSISRKPPRTVRPKCGRTARRAMSAFG